MAVVGSITALIATMLITTSSSASLADGPFEIEGNLVVDDTVAPKLDWATAATSGSVVCIDDTNTSANEIKGCGIDKPTGQTDDSFGNGTKEDSPIPTVTDGSIPNNKSDLTRFYAASNKDGGKDMLYLAWERVQDPSGTTNMDFEFNQGSTSTNGVTKDRKGGDVLIKFDLSQGGVNPTFGIHRWQDGTTNWSGACEASAKLPCWGVGQAISQSSTNLATGAVNTTGSVVDPIAPFPTGQASRTLSIRTFGEAAINLTDTNVLGEDCATFGSAYLKSRSSDSFTAAVKDFIAPVPVSISNCGSIKLTKTFSAGAPSTPAVFVLYKNNAPLDAPHGAEDTLITAAAAATKLSAAVTSVSATSMTVSDGTKLPAAPFYAKVDNEVIKVTAKSANVLTVERAKVGTTAATHAVDAGVTLVSTCSYTALSSDCSFTALKLANYILSEVETPAGYQTAGDRAVPVTGIPPTEVTIANTPSPKDIDVAKRDGAGGAVKICTSTITADCAAYTLYPLGASVALAAPGVNNSTTTFAFASTTGFPATPFTALVDKEIVSVTGKTATTLAVTRAQMSTTAAAHATGAAVEVVVTSGTPSTCVPDDSTAALAGNCTFASVNPGSYVVVETTHPTGRGKDSDLPDRITVALSDTSPIPRSYDNPPLYKVVTVVCALSGTAPSLYPSKLAYDTTIASGASPVTPGSGSLAGSGITDAEICGLSGSYVLNNAVAGGHTSDINIP
jgi:hypothetical protein